MPEAITRYAVNSTLGTSDFKPLDQIITGQKRLVASENLYCPVYGYTYFRSDEVTSPKVIDLFRFKHVNGSFKLKLNAKRSGGACDISFLKNGQLVKKITLSTSFHDDYTNAVYASKGDIISIKIEFTTGSYSEATINNINLCADVIDTSAIELLSEV